MEMVAVLKQENILFLASIKGELKLTLKNGHLNLHSSKLEESCAKTNKKSTNTNSNILLNPPLFKTLNLPCQTTNGNKIVINGFYMRMIPCQYMSVTAVLTARMEKRNVN